MSELENKKSKKSKQKKQDNKTDVLERVMDSIEMAGASLDFFEDDGNVEDKEALDLKEFKKTQKKSKPLKSNEDSTHEVPFDESELEKDFAQSMVETELTDLSNDNSFVDTEDTEYDDDEPENLDLLESESNLEFIEQNQAYSIIESLLFSSDRPLGLGTFKQVFHGTQFKLKDIKKALEDLQVRYADVQRGVELEEINGGWQLRTKVDNMDFLRKLAKARPFKLSGPALEVLAIIAYKQPLVKSEVDDIRGVESGHLVRALMEKNLVSFQGKSELPGKPMQYGTTRKFLEIFGLRNLRELPSLDEIDQLLPDGIGMEEEDEKLSDVTEKLSEQYSGNYSEGEEELLKIESTLMGIDTSSEFFEHEKLRQKEKRDRDRARDIQEALDVGEEVDKKDQTWLNRYVDKQKMEAQARLAQEEEINSQKLDELIAKPKALTDELSTLSGNNLIKEDVLEADDQFENEDDVSFANEMNSADNEIETQANGLDPFEDMEEDL